MLNTATELTACVPGSSALKGKFTLFCEREETA